MKLPTDEEIEEMFPMPTDEELFKSGFILYGIEAWKEIGEVTHWMPLPESANKEIFKGQ